MNKVDKDYRKREREGRRSRSKDRKIHRKYSSSSNSSYDRRERSKKDRQNPRRKHKEDRRDKRAEFEFSDTERKTKSEVKSINPKNDKDSDEESEIEKELPCFEPSGILAEFQNQYKGIVLKFTEPLDAAIPDEQWKLYPFKGEESFDGINISKKSVYLFGREPKVADIMLENPSCSMQHAVIQYRERQVTRDLSQAEQTARGLFQGFITEQVVKPYLMDLESTNGTVLNGSAIEPARYYELREKDVLRFGQSLREYVLMKK